MDPTNSNVLYAATVGSGVYLSQNSGQSWQVFNQGLTMREMRDLDIASDGSVVYAATNGAGVFRLGTPVIAYQAPESGEAQPAGGEPQEETPTSGVMTEEETQPTGEEGGFSTIFMVGIGVVVVAAVVFVGLVVMRRRRKGD